MDSLGAALEAAEYALAALERRIDRLIGAPLRRGLGRYLAVAVLGAPTAFVVGAVLSGALRWTGLTWAGFGAGIALFALIDVVRFSARRASRPAARPAEHPGAGRDAGADEPSAADSD